MLERDWKRVAGLLITFLLAATMVGAEPTGSPPAPAGEEAAGAVPGEAALANGGAPCLAFHGITGFGLAGGANYGPDLTGLFESFGDEGLADMLKTLPFPSMEPVYASRPLTDGEKADLRAFFAQVQGAPVARTGLLIVEVLGGVLIIMAVALRDYLEVRLLPGTRKEKERS